MGKGDRKSKRGKIFMGSYGNTRKRKKKKNRKFVVVPKVQVVTPEVETAVVVEQPVEKPKRKYKPRTEKKPAKKKKKE